MSCNSLRSASGDKVEDTTTETMSDIFIWGLSSQRDRVKHQTMINPVTYFGHNAFFGYRAHFKAEYSKYITMVFNYVISANRNKVFPASSQLQQSLSWGNCTWWHVARWFCNLNRLWRHSVKRGNAWKFKDSCLSFKIRGAAWFHSNKIKQHAVSGLQKCISYNGRAVQVMWLGMQKTIILVSD